MSAVAPVTMNAIASASSSHDMLANTSQGRNRSASAAVYPAQEESHVEESRLLPRAASYTYFPQVKDLLEEPSVLELKGTISEHDLKSTASIDGRGSYSSSAGSSPETETAPQTEQPPQLKRTTSRPSTRFLPFSSRSRDSSEEPASKKSNYGGRQSMDARPSMSPARSLTKLRRKSWVASTSRSASPNREAESPNKAAPKKDSKSSEKRKSLTLTVSNSDKTKSKDAAEGSPTTKGRVLTKKPKRPLSGLFNSSNAQESSPTVTNAPPLPPIPKSFSTERLPSFTQSPTSPTQIPPIPRTISSDKLKGTKPEPRKKDELWTAFRTLDADLRKFHSKSLALKTNVVRTTLMPFLKAYASHPSNHKLRPEDLDRRANILNGWWTGLLELLSGRNNLSISGTDRPAILDGITGIMERPEWRLAPSPFCALADRSDSSSTTTTNSSASLSSGSSDFLAESVYHNIRNVFIQNLLSQMAFVVEKMSLRSAAASLVTFCGKTCAYAFCFCPGIADVLVRLWELPSDAMKRVLEELGIPRHAKLDDVASRIIPSFPPNLHSLKFNSVAKTVRSLRQPAKPPLGTGHLDWYGIWVKRWSGAETDLFYVFVKHYHILVTDFLSGEPSNAERICVPGLVIVHAQILVNLDATVNRHAAPLQADEVIGGSSTVTFDDVLSDPDAAANTLPIPPANATRQMAENRLIMLIRDFLSERNTHLSAARRFFAQSFSSLLKATARKVSIYDNNACYTLCDFLEEAFLILARFEQIEPHHHSVLDWPFWLTVCKQMTISQNTATEIKLFAFLYSIWPFIVTNEQRKASMCLEFLLEPDFFDSRFNHWCPMVRAYFMRLLCWRVARFDGEETVAEINIIRALSDRLRSTWSHYLYLRENAEVKRTVLPSTTPCNPAPGRRFLIIRNDTPLVTNAGPFLSFDGVVQSPISRRLSSMNPVSESDARPVSAQSVESQDFAEDETPKKKWSLLRNLIGTPKSVSKSQAANPSEWTSKVGSLSQSKKPSESASAKRSPSPETSSLPAHRSFSFRFSLEWVDKRYQPPQNMRIGPPRLPLPAQVLLHSQGINVTSMPSSKPVGASVMPSRYAGRALAEWTLMVHECQNFFDRRKNEGVPSNRLVETPTMAVEAFRRPG